MFYLRRCCCCVDLRKGAMIVGVVHSLLDLVVAFFVAACGNWGDQGDPNGVKRIYIGHQLFIIFTLFHFFSCVFFVFGSALSRSTCMVFYVAMTMLQILVWLVMIVMDLARKIWSLLIITYFLMLPIVIYFWLIGYSLYISLGGTCFN